LLRRSADPGDATWRSVFTVLFFVIYALVAPITGYIADASIRSAELTIVRKTFMAIGHGVAIVGVFACYSADDRAALAGIIVMSAGWASQGRTSMPSRRRWRDQRRLASGSRQD
jgi:hypothetical protein